MQEAFPPIKILGFGCVSALGLGDAATVQSLRQSADCISPVRLFPVERCQSRSAGQVSEAVSEQATAIAPPARRWSRVAQMILVAMDEALRASPGFVPDAVVMGTTSGGMDLGEEFYRAVAAGEPAWKETRKVRSYMPQQPVRQSLEIFRFNVPVRIVSTACSSGTSALGMACQMIRAGSARRVLAGGYDALSEMVFSGFDCLRASTPEKCRPFDKDRTGLSLGEGAAVFCLEKGSDGLCITGYGSATDIHHLTQPHPSGSGPLAAMQLALNSAGLDPASIDYINAHGTGTPLNDASEARALLELFPGVPVSSTKGMMGHALGAAGAIEAALCCLAMRENFLPANINYRESEFPLNLVANGIRAARPRRTLSNSFGFGGANAAIILERRES